MMNNRVMLFYDYENFKKSLMKRDKTRPYDIGRAQYAIMKLLKNLVKLDCENHCLVRSYVYTGEYTPKIIKRIQNEVEDSAKILDAIERCTLGLPERVMCDDPNFLKKVKSRYVSQQELIRIASNFNFFEFKTCPLKYENARVFQKGVDVQLAVDLVSHAYKNNFDIAVVCSGDVDLLESLRLVKSLGKKIIVMSHPKVTASDIRKECDYFIDVSKLRDNDLNEFTRNTTHHQSRRTHII